MYATAGSIARSWWLSIVTAAFEASSPSPNRVPRWRPCSSMPGSGCQVGVASQASADARRGRDRAGEQARIGKPAKMTRRASR